MVTGVSADHESRARTQLVRLSNKFILAKMRYVLLNGFKLDLTWPTLRVTARRFLT